LNEGFLVYLLNTIIEPYVDNCIGIYIYHSYAGKNEEYGYKDHIIQVVYISFTEYTSVIKKATLLTKSNP